VASVVLRYLDEQVAHVTGESSADPDDESDSDTDAETEDEPAGTAAEPATD
jgi:hypothetical protein